MIDIEKIKELGRFSFRDVEEAYDYSPSAIGEIFKSISETRKIALVYANCQSFFISRLMQRTVEFSEYVFCEMPWIQKMNEKEKRGFDKEYMKFIDLFVYQNVSLENNVSEYLATDEYVKPLLRDDCIKVSIPFVYFMGYHPQYTKNIRNRSDDISPCGDIKINSFVFQGKKTREIKKLLLSDRLYTKDEVLDNIQKSFGELKKREVKCDVIISDYIERNYRDRLLFYIPSHPTNEVLIELIKRVADCIGIECSFKDTDVQENDRHIMNIYPSVYKHAELTFYEKPYRFCRVKGQYDTNEEYIEKYINYNFSYHSNRVNNIKDALFIDTNKVTERLKGSMVYKGSSVHLSLYLTIESDSLSGTIMKIAKRYAPTYVHTALMYDLSNNTNSVPVFIRPDGCVNVISRLKKGNIAIIDTSWAIDEMEL